MSRTSSAWFRVCQRHRFSESGSAAWSELKFDAFNPVPIPLRRLIETDE